MTAPSSGLFNNSFLSDVTICQVSGDKSKEYLAHKAVLCAHSEYFMRMFSGNFKETSESAVTLQDDDPVHFEVMLKYIYTLEFDTPPLEAWTTNNLFEQVWALPIGVYTLADKYGVKELKRIAAGRFSAATADYHTLESEQPLKVVEAHYATCVQGDCLMGQAIARKLLLSNRNFVKGEQFACLLKRYPNLGADVLLVAPRYQGKLW